MTCYLIPFFPHHPNHHVQPATFFRWTSLNHRYVVVLAMLLVGGSLEGVVEKRLRFQDSLCLKSIKGDMVFLLCRFFDSSAFMVETIYASFIPARTQELLQIGLLFTCKIGLRLPKWKNCETTHSQNLKTSCMNVDQLDMNHRFGQMRMTPQMHHICWRSGGPNFGS